MSPLLIGIAGGSGSGKTTLAKRIINRFKNNVSFISLDNYYHDQSHITLEERRKINYDHPSAFDFALFKDHLRSLKRGEVVYSPTYSFSQYIRLPETIKVEPKDVVVVEGILVLWDQDVRDLLDIKIYVDCDSDLRFIRRMLRDIKERGREMEIVIEQYISTVRPMHIQFVEPTKRYADIIVPEGGYNNVAFELIISRISQFLERKDVEQVKT